MGKRVFAVAKEVELFMNIHQTINFCFKAALRNASIFRPRSRHFSDVNCSKSRLLFLRLSCHKCDTDSVTSVFLYRYKFLQFRTQLLVGSAKFLDYTVKRCASTLTKKSHYEILNVTRSASSDEIRQAFITLSKTWHPDKNTNDPSRHQKIVQINEAYSVLSKPLSRRDYDLSLDAQKYVARQMSAATSRTYGYGDSPHAGPYYHYRDHVYHDEFYWAQDSYSSQPSKFSSLFNFYMLMACATFTTVSIIMHYMYNYIPNPKHNHLRNNLTLKEIEKHDLLMQSEQDGTTFYYYAVPREDSKQVDIVVMKKSQDSQSTDELRMEEVTRSPK